MFEFLKTLDLQAMFLILCLLFVVRGISRTIKDEGNSIEWWQFYSTKGADGRQYGDPNKLGVFIGMFASTLFVGYMFWAQKVDNWYVVVTFALWLVFIAGSEAFAKWFRTFLDAKVVSKQTPDLPKMEVGAPDSKGS